MARLKLDPEQLEVTSFASAPPGEVTADTWPQSVEASLCYISCAVACMTDEYDTCYGPPSYQC